MMVTIAEFIIASVLELAAQHGERTTLSMLQCLQHAHAVHLGVHEAWPINCASTDVGLG